MHPETQFIQATTLKMQYEMNRIIFLKVHIKGHVLNSPTSTIKQKMQTRVLAFSPQTQEEFQVGNFRTLLFPLYDPRGI